MHIDDLCHYALHARSYKTFTLFATLLVCDKHIFCEPFPWNFRARIFGQKQQESASPGAGPFPLWSPFLHTPRASSNSILRKVSQLAGSLLTSSRRQRTELTTRWTYKVAPALLSAITSRLSKARSQSPQPGASSRTSSSSSAMGQANSKKAKKGSKDRDGGGEKDAENGAPDVGPTSESITPSSSNASAMDENTSQGAAYLRRADPNAH